MTKRSVNMVAAAFLVLMVVAGVVYATAGFASVFSCDADSGCFFPTFFVPTHDAVDMRAASSAALASVAIPPAQQGQTDEAAERARVPASSGATAEPLAIPAETPNAVNSAAAPPTATVAPPAAPPPIVQEAPPAVAEPSPGTDPVPSSSASAAAPAAPVPTIPTIPMEPEPGVLTDPPAGVVPDENTNSGEPPSINGPAPPNVFVPIIIVPPAANGSRSR